MNIVVTGACGFIGSQMVPSLIKAGHKIAVIVRATSNLEVLQEVAEQITVYTISDSVTQLAEFFKDFNAELILHLASRFLASHTPDQVADLIDSNIKLSTMLCEAMMLSGVTKMLNTGTSWQHFNNQAYLPVNLYAATKQAFYAILAYYVDAHQFNVINLELYDTYGAADTRRKLIYLLKSCVQEGKSLEMSPGKQELILLHIDDVIAAYEVAIERLSKATEPGMETYALDSDEKLSLEALIALINETVAPAKLDVALGARPYREREVMTLWNKGKRPPGWGPQKTLGTGLKEIFTD